jgi:voltage-gated potassium channel Kch
LALGVMEKEIRVRSASTELKDTTYELFIGALSVLSIINLFLYYVINNSVVSGVVVIIDGLLSLIFLVDFLFRLFTADSKSRYFLVQFGWADLLATLPFPLAKILRLFRSFRAGRLMGKRLGNRAHSALLSLLFFIILVLEFGGMAMVAVESNSTEANIHTPFDAVWYTFVTITTVGYGDRYPVTTEGRLIGIVIMTAGVGLFGTLTGYLANAFLAPPKRKEAQIAADGDSPKAKLAQLKQLLNEQKQAQVALEAKISEIEALL